MADEVPAEGVDERGEWARSTRLLRSLTPDDNFYGREELLVRCGCVRRLSQLFRPGHADVLHEAERIADGDVPARTEFGPPAEPLTELLTFLTHVSRGPDDYLFRLLALVGAGREDRAAEVAAQEAVVRDVLGNPERGVGLDARWLTTDVTGLARYVYESSDFSALPLLGDALEDAGCGDDTVLDHCPAPGPHVRGRWVVDAALGLRSEDVWLRQFGMIDPLTMLGNRFAFHTTLNGAVCRAVAARTRLAVVSLDLDGFVMLNHRFGHRGGDEVLSGVGRSLRDALGGDGFLARTGGDEFSAVLPSTELPAVFEVGERLRRAVEGWRPNGGRPEGGPVVTASVGLATFEPNTSDDLLRRANGAVGRAKMGGRNRVSI